MVPSGRGCELRPHGRGVLIPQVCVQPNHDDGGVQARRTDPDVPRSSRPAKGATEIGRVGLGDHRPRGLTLDHALREHLRSRLLHIHRSTVAPVGTDDKVCCAGACGRLPDSTTSSTLASGSRSPNIGAAGPPIRLTSGSTPTPRGFDWTVTFIDAVGLQAGPDLMTAGPALRPGGAITMSAPAGGARFPVAVDRDPRSARADTAQPVNRVWASAIWAANPASMAAPICAVG